MRYIIGQYVITGITLYQKIGKKTNELYTLTNYFFKNLCKKNFKKDNIYYIFLIPLNHILKQIIPANFLLKLFQSCKLDGK